MLNYRPAAGVFLRFCVVFGLLLYPWPGLREGVQSLFHAELKGLSGVFLPRMFVRVEPFVDPDHRSIDTLVQMADPRTRQPDGSANVKGISLDSRSVGWIPQVMLLALIAATPGSWVRRVRASLILPPILNLLIATTLGLTLWHVDSEGSAEWKRQALAFVYDLSIQNLWFSFLAPTAVWWLFTILADSPPGRPLRGSR